MSPIQMINNAAQLFTGQVGGGLILMAIIIGGIIAAFERHWAPLYAAFGGSVFVVGAAWIVQTVYNLSVG